MQTDVLLQLEEVTKTFPVRGELFRKSAHRIKALDRVSFSLRQKKTLGVVGESGSGKSTLGRVIMLLLKPDEGHVMFQGQNLCALNSHELRSQRRFIQMVFQDSIGSFNHRFTVREIVSESLEIYGLGDKTERLAKAKKLLDRVGLPQNYLARYPHELSGGQRQRLGIARALSVSPKLIIADEAISALDLSIQAQIINLFQDLQDQTGVSYVFISHDLNITCHVSDQIAIMYLGRILETAPAENFRNNSLHPYTKALLSSALEANPLKKTELFAIPGEIPSPVNLPIGCAFRLRCPLATEICAQKYPPLLPFASNPNHLIACHKINNP